MIKHELREDGYSVMEKSPKQSRINLLWIVLALVLIAGTILGINLFFKLTMGADGDDLQYFRATAKKAGNSNPLSDFIESLSSWLGIEGIGSFVIFLLLFFILLILYFVLKLIMTIVFSRDKLNSIKLKVLLDKGMPVCSCKEAFKVWQTVLVYAVPFAFMYLLLFTACIWTIGEPIFMLLLAFMSFFLSFDLTVVIYVLLINAKNDIDYISIDHHFYSMTLFKQTYVRSSDRPVRQHIAEITKDQPEIESFIEITSCANLDCDNYRHELDENAAVCPLCGKRTYRAIAMANMQTCINDRCKNYGEELKHEAAVCSLCGEKTGNLALRFDRNLTVPSVVISIISAVYFCFVDWAMFDAQGPLVSTLNFIGVLMLAVSIWLGFRSKSKIAMIIAVVAVLACIGFNIFIKNS